MSSFFLERLGRARVVVTREPAGQICFREQLECENFWLTHILVYNVKVKREPSKISDRMIRSLSNNAYTEVRIEFCSAANCKRKVKRMCVWDYNYDQGYWTSLNDEGKNKFISDNLLIDF